MVGASPGIRPRSNSSFAPTEHISPQDGELVSAAASSSVEAGSTATALRSNAGVIGRILLSFGRDEDGTPNGYVASYLRGKRR